MIRSDVPNPGIETLLPSPTPNALGYYMPAEWRPHQGTWFSWPHNPDTWGRHLGAAERALAGAVRWLARGETVHINVLDEVHARHVASLLEHAGVDGSVRFHHVPTNDSWCRDHGAIFLIHPHRPGYAAVDWGYNAWGGKYPPYDLDDAVPARMCEALDALRFATPIVLEGGSIEVNGAGTLLTTESCLLHPNRNPGLDRPAIEHALREMLGVRHIHWLSGELAGDDTDGHIDNLARFVDATTIVAAEEKDPSDVNHRPLAENLDRLRALRAPDGRPYRVVTLPMPAPFFIDGRRMPASYVNFYVGNEVVLMPAYDDPTDEAARSILQACFPERLVVAVDCRAIIWGLGALHCLSQQVPRPVISPAQPAALDR